MGDTCVPQAVPFLPLVDAALISSNGLRDVHRLIKFIPPPPAFKANLSEAFNTTSRFSIQINRVLAASARLNDRTKTIAEVFAPNAALQMIKLALNELFTRNSDVKETAIVLFAVTAAVRDALIGSATVKVQYSSIRPITVLQCAKAKPPVRTAWLGPYQGVGRFKSGTGAMFMPYITTPPFPAYVSGHSAAAGAATRVLELYFGEPVGANCVVRRRGMSVREGRVRKRGIGFVDGVTNVANKGKRTVGFVPGKTVRVCWNSWAEFADVFGKARVLGGIHIPLDIEVGTALGRKVGLRFKKVLRGRTGGKNAFRRGVYPS